MSQIRSENEERTKNSSNSIMDLHDPNTPSYYANVSFISLGGSEIILTFGSYMDGDGRGSTVPVAKITITHDNFMRMVELWATRYQFLNKIYGQNRTSMATIDPILFQSALAEMLGTSANQPDLKDDKNETS